MELDRRVPEMCLGQVDAEPVIEKDLDRSGDQSPVAWILAAVLLQRDDIVAKKCDPVIRELDVIRVLACSD